MIKISDAINLINSEIEKISFPAQPGMLYRPAEYVLAAGGKRIRPALVLFTCNVYSGDYSEAILPSIGIEMFHNFTLVHDDIMDNSPLRRGQPTVHVKWGRDTAILSGDAMMVLANRFVCGAPAPVLKPVMELFNATALEVCEGQQYDMDFEQMDTVSEAQYLEMIRLKTSVLLGAAMKMGAIIGRAPEKDAALLYTFGINTGMAFQLRDDLLDVYGSEGFGKQRGGDIIANKKTLLLIRALSAADHTIRERLMNLLSSSWNDPQEKVAKVLEIYNQLGIENAVNVMITNYHLKAVDALKKLTCTSEAKNELMQFAESLAVRTR